MQPGIQKRAKPRLPFSAAGNRHTLPEKELALVLGLVLADRSLLGGGSRQRAGNPTRRNWEADIYGADIWGRYTGQIYGARQKSEKTHDACRLS